MPPDQPAAQAPKQINLRYAGTCRDCGTGLPVGSSAMHYKDERKVACLDCWDGIGAGDAQVENSDPEPPARESVPPPTVAEADERVLANPRPGSSALREYDRRHAKREEDLRRRWGRAGKVIAWWQDDPQSTRAWSKGGKGEREAGLYLEEKLRDSECEILHDRLIPGSKANIDHVVVGPGGVTVFDTKNYKGKMRVSNVGIGRSRRAVLTVDGRDKSDLIAGVQKQLDAVVKVLDSLDLAIQIEVIGGLLWWHYEGMPFFGKNLAVGEIRVFSPKEAHQTAMRAGALTSHQIGQVAFHLDAHLKPAA